MSAASWSPGPPKRKPYSRPHDWSAVTLTRVLVVPFPLDLGRLGQAIAGATRLVAPSGPLVWATHTPIGLGSLSLELASGTVQAAAWGEGAPWLADQLPALVGLLDDTSTFVAHHPVIADEWRRGGPERFGATGRLFDALLPAVLGQKVQTTLAEQSLRWLVRTYGEVAPGPVSLVAYPAAAVLARLSYASFHSAGVERRRAEVIIRAARVANRLEEGGRLGVAVAAARLQSLSGVGPWTTAMTLAPALGDADAVALGDAHLPNVVSWGLVGEPRGTDDRMVELVEPYRGHRARVLALLRRAHVSPPKYGPRLEAIPLSRFDGNRPPRTGRGERGAGNGAPSSGAGGAGGPAE